MKLRDHSSPIAMWFLRMVFQRMRVDTMGLRDRVGSTTYDRVGSTFMHATNYEIKIKRHKRTELVKYLH